MTIAALLKVGLRRRLNPGEKTLTTQPDIPAFRPSLGAEVTKSQPRLSWSPTAAINHSGRDTQ